MENFWAMNIIKRLRQKKPRTLGVLLCYNDGDILEDLIKHFLNNNHEIVVWDHGSKDETAEILRKYKSNLLESKFVPRSFDFYKLYPSMSENLINNYIGKFDWISWPDDDEILEGPKRDGTYYEHITQAYNSKYNWIQFNNYNFWFTRDDDSSIKSPIERVKHYCLFPDCAPRIRSWRAHVTNIREFNHNPLSGERFPALFNLRHYPMRSREQAIRRLKHDRSNIQRGAQNYHYNKAKNDAALLLINPKKLHYDNGSDLKDEVIFNWRTIYGYS